MTVCVFDCVCDSLCVCVWVFEGEGRGKVAIPGQRVKNSKRVTYRKVLLRHVGCRNALSVLFESHYLQLHSSDSGMRGNRDINLSEVKQTLEHK